MKKHPFTTLAKSLLIFSSLAVSPATFYADSSSGFALSEHWAMGQQVKLRFDVNQQPETAVPLHLKNGLVLSYGDIMSLGDLYGIIGRPISHGLTKDERQSRFKDAFKSFAKNFIAIEEVKELNAVVKKEIEAVNFGIEHGEKAEAIYERIGNEIGRQINCITGGGCTSMGWWLYPGRYLLLAMENFDHFSPNNIIAYKNGHQAALQQALKARQTGNKADLELAYAMDAFASHYLSDRFAAGHLRTPRENLADKVTPAVLGSLLSSYMHSEENKYGIHVHNDLGERWVVYGDFSYFNPFNQPNQQMLLRTLQTSADEIFEAYFTGIIPDKSVVLHMIPHPEQLNGENDLDIAPMFYWDEQSKQIYRRTDLSNPYDRHWTNNWWGWSTWVILKTQYGVSSTLQLSLTQHLSQYKPKELDTSLFG